MARSRAADTTEKPRSDAYVGLLAIALLAQIGAAVFFFLDYNQYPAAKPPAVPTVSSSPSAPPQGGVQPGAGAAGGAPGMGGAPAMGGGAPPPMGGGMAGMMGGNVN